MSFTCEQSDIIRGGIVWCSWREEGDGDGGSGVVLREALIACWSFPSRKERGQSRGKCEESQTEKKKKKKKRRDTFFVISFIVVITLILLDSLCLSRLSLSLSLLIMCCFLSLRAQSFNLRLEVRLLLFVRQLRQLELLTGVSRLRSRLLRKTRVFANRVVDFLV